jgi:hypothetical protein
MGTDEPVVIETVRVQIPGIRVAESEPVQRHIISKDRISVFILDEQTHIDIIRKPAPQIS